MAVAEKPKLTLAKMLLGCFVLPVLLTVLVAGGVFACVSAIGPSEAERKEIEARETAAREALAKSNALNTQALRAAFERIGPPFFPATVHVDDEFAAVRVSNAWYDLRESVRRTLLANAADEWKRLSGREDCILRVVDEGDAKVGGYLGRRVYLED